MYVDYITVSWLTAPYKARVIVYWLILPQKLFKIRVSVNSSCLVVISHSYLIATTML